jgi:CBS domain-containing protein
MAAEPRAVDFARDDVVTCGPRERLGEVLERVNASAFGFALVVSDGGVLLGRLPKAALEAEPGAMAETVMEPGPSTVRADLAPERLRERLEHQGLTAALITDPDGRLLGVVARVDLPAG